jgi:hypothetical protein
VVVAVVAVRVVKVAGDAIIHVVAVRHRLMAATGTVHMARLVPTATMVGSAAVGVRARHFDHMLVDMIFVRVVEVTVVQIVYVATVAHGGVSAARAMRHADEHGRHGSGQSKWSWCIILSVSKIRGHRCAALGRVVDSVTDQRQHMLVGKHAAQIQRRCHSVNPFDR